MPKRVIPVVRAMASGIVAISSFTIVGYAIKIPWLYQWAEDVGMAFNAACAHLLAGFCLLLITLRDDK